MTAEPEPTGWRAAALRGLAHAGDRDEALVRLGVDQFLRIPIAAGRAAAFEARIGRRVWVDLEAWAVELDAPRTARHG